MKKFISLVLALTMMLCMVVVANAENELALNLTTADNEVCAGDTVKVDVSFKNNPGVTGSVIDITYDYTVLELVKVEQGAFVQNGFFAEKSDVEGTVCVDFAAINALTGEAPICTLTFEVKENAELGDTGLSASSNDTTDGAVNPGQLTVLDGELTLTVVDFLWGDVNDDGVADGIDAVLIMQYAAGTLAYEDLPKPKAGDTNNDTIIDGVDAVLIMQYAAGTYTPNA